MTVKQVFSDGKWPVKVWTNDIDAHAEKQLKTLGHLPFIHHHISVMADAHGGLGSTIGSVIPTKGAIIPAAVGVDLGCGMMAYQLNIQANDLPDNLHPIRDAIEQAVPHGRTANGGPNDRGAWGDTPDPILMWWAEHGIEAKLPDVLARHPGLLKGNVNTHRHLGTLGTGNHFIEVCLDENDQVWVMLHSGSRGVGNRIGSYFIRLAKREMERWFISLPDKDLAYLVEGAEHFEDYVKAVGWAQDYAKNNRVFMMNATLGAIESVLGRAIEVGEVAVNCHHNYVARENHYGANVWVTRKGAIRARVGDLGVIPSAMGQPSYIVRGRGNAESFHSCSHGAGRCMSRTEARKRFTTKDLIEQTKGVECRKDEAIIDECPGAYKSMDQVMANQTDLVDVVHTLKAAINCKG